MKPAMVIPMLICSNPNAEIQFCMEAFNAKVLSKRVSNEGTVLHATLLVNTSLIMIHDVSGHLTSLAPEMNGSSPVVLYIYGENVDPVVDRAVAAGAKILMPAQDQSWGDRVGRILDPQGHVWNIASRIITPAEPDDEPTPTPAAAAGAPVMPAAGQPSRQE